MKKFLSIFIAVAMVMSFASVFSGQATVAKAESGQAIINILKPNSDPNNVETKFVGQTFYVDAVISNPTDSAMSGSAVLDPGATAIVLDDASKNESIPAHGTVDVWWKLQCVKAGDSTITVSFNGVSKSVTVHQKNKKDTKLVVSIIEAPTDTIAPSTDFVIKAKAQNVTDPGSPFAVDISDLKATIQIDGPAELLNPDATITDPMLYAGDTDTFAWNLHCTGPGKVVIKVNAVGKNNATGKDLTENEILLVKDPVIVDQGEVKQYGNLNVTLDAYKKVCTDCNSSIFHVKARVCNETGVDLTDVNGTISYTGPASLQGSKVMPFGDEIIYKDVYAPSDGDTLTRTVPDPNNPTTVNYDAYLRFADLDGTGAWVSGDDPVYYDADHSGDVSAGDFRVTSSDKYTAGVFPNYDGLNVSLSEAYGINNNTTINIITDQHDKVTSITSNDSSLTITPYDSSDTELTYPFDLSSLSYIIAKSSGKNIKVIINSSSPDGTANTDVIGITKGTYAAGSTVAAGDSDIGITLSNDSKIMFDDNDPNGTHDRWDTTEPVIYDLVDLGKYDDNGIANGACKEVEWTFKCTGEGPVDFNVTVEGTGPAPDSQVFSGSATITVDQKDVLTEFVTEGDGAPQGDDAELVMPGDLIDDSGNVWVDVNHNGKIDTTEDKELNATVNDSAIPYGIYNTSQTDLYEGVGDSFDVTAMVKNCTCATFLNTVTRLEDANGNPLPMDNIEFDPNNMTAHIVKYSLDTSTNKFKKDEEYDMNITGDGAVTLDLCSCCYYEVTWHLKCTAASIDKLNVVTRDNTGKLLDSDTLTVHQGGPACISTGLEVFPGWYSDGTLGTSERFTYSCGQEFTVVVPVTNIGGRTADDVYIPITASGDWSMNSGDLATTISQLAPGESYKIIIEGTCTGDDNLVFSIGKITGKDDVTHKDIDCIYKPDDLKITQIPVCVTFMNPAASDGWTVDSNNYIHIPVSTDYAVKVKITNNSDPNDPANGQEDLKDVKVTLHWATQDPQYSWIWHEGVGAELNNDTAVKIVGNSGIPAGESREVAWNMHCTSPGFMKYWVTIEPANYDLYIDSRDQTDGCCPESEPVKYLYQDPETNLAVQILSPAQYSTYATGQQFAVTAKVINIGHKTAKDVVVSINPYTFEPSYSYPYFKKVEFAKVIDDPHTSPQEVSVGTLAPGEEKMFTWTLQCIKPSGYWYYYHHYYNDDPVKVVAYGSNTLASSNTVPVFQYPAAKLVVHLDPIPDVTKGSDFTITGTIGNYGWADATNVVLTLTASDNLAPQPGYSFTLPIGTVPAMRDSTDYQPIPFTFHVQCEAAGKTSVKVTPSGEDEYGFSWVWANRKDLGIEDVTMGEFIDFVYDVYYDGGADEYALKPIPDFCLVPASTTFKQVMPAGPTLTISSPADGLVTNNPDVTVTFSATGGTEPYTFAAMLDGSGAVGGNWISPIPAGSYTFHNLTEGTHTLFIKVTDANSKSYIGFVNVVVDYTPPVITVTAPEDGATVGTDTVTVEGTVTDNVEVAQLSINSTAVSFAADGSFSVNCALSEGENTIKIVAFDTAGNRTEKDITVTYTTAIPGDLNNDGKVDLTDLSMLMANWGTADPTADINGDGIVDLTDLSILMSHWTG